MAPHVQDASDEAVAKVAQEKGVAFAVAQTGAYTKPISGIPFYVVFDHTGREIYSGHSTDEALEKTDKALLAAPLLPLGPEPFALLKGLAAKAQAKKDLGKVLSAARREAEAEGAPAAAEGARLAAAIQAYLDKQMAYVETLREEDLLACDALLTTLEKEFRGDPVSSERIREAADGLRKSPGFSSQKAAFKKVAKVEEELARLVPCSTCAAGIRRMDIGCADCRDRNGPALADYRRRLQKWEKDWAGTPAGRRVAALLARLQ